MNKLVLDRVEYEKMTDFEKILWLTEQADWIYAEFEKIKRSEQVNKFTKGETNGTIV